jgi:hypothetical protein
MTFDPQECASGPARRCGLGYELRMTTRALAVAFSLGLLVGCLQAIPQQDAGVAPSSDAGLAAADSGNPAAGDAGSTDAGGSGNADAGPVTGFTAGPTGCAELTVAANADLGGYKVDRYAWGDGRCEPRSAALVRNDARDPGNTSGGYLRELTWRSAGATRTSRGTGANGWQGWGYVVNHYSNTADVSTGHTGTFRTVFAGAHHALHEFRLRMTPGGPVDATVQWFFATGRSNPIYAITFDATPAGANAVNADTRAPYGDFAFEGTPGEIAGIGWGDSYRFTTTGAGPVRLSSTWDYTQRNVVPYVRMWSSAVDAEMGAVQTQSFEQHVAGGDYGGGILTIDCWGKTSATKGAQCSYAGQTMPKEFLWPFQLNQYELPASTTSHRLAWGSSYGAIGQTSASAFGKTFAGYPKVSYSVFVVIGARTGEATMTQVTEVERVLGAALSATEGTVATTASAGAGRTDTVALAPAGYSPVFGTWEVGCAQSRATVTLDPKGKALSAPVFRFSGFTQSQLGSVTLNGQALTPGVAYFATVDAAQQTVWLTLNGAVTAPVVLHVE